MSKQASKGECSLCGKSFSGAAMTRHLAACGGFIPPPEIGASGKMTFHLVVKGGYGGMYWLHLAAPAAMRLSDLDSFLRHIWLECCGHLSAFSIEGRQYMSDTSEPGDRGMNVPMDRVLRPGREFSYEYDFGSTTELKLKVAGLREGGTPVGKIQLLARNDEPQVLCNRCGPGKIATQICPDCSNSPDDGWFCDECAEEHDCGLEMLLPVVNSPRTGVCGYGG